SVRSICADSISWLSPATASVGARNRPRATVFTTSAFTRRERNLVMHGHPLRYRLEGAETAPDRHGDKEPEIEHGQDLRQQFLAGAAGLRAQVTQDQERDREQRDHHLVQERPVTDRLHRAAVEPR